MRPNVTAEGWRVSTYDACTDFNFAVTKAREWNAKHDAHRGVNCAKPTLGPIIPMTLSTEIHMARASNASRLACFYRHIEYATCLVTADNLQFPKSKQHLVMGCSSSNK
jgi:hypothetical protein